MGKTDSACIVGGNRHPYLPVYHDWAVNREDGKEEKKMKDVRDVLLIGGMYFFAAYGFVHFLNDVGLLSKNFW